MLHSLLALLAGNRSRGSKRAVAARSRRLTLEVLEARTLPTVHLFARHLLLPVPHDGSQSGQQGDQGDEGKGGTDTSPPHFTTTALPAAVAGAAYFGSVAATGTPAPTFSEVAGPAELSVDPGSGAITWTPTAAQLGTQTVTVRASNSIGSVTASFVIQVGPDTTPPSQPYITLLASTTTSLTLGFTAFDNVGVAGCRLYVYTPAVYRGHSGRDGGITLVSPAKYTLLVDNITTNQYTVTGLTPGTHYDYAVSAFDAAGTKSVYSVPFVAETQLLPSLRWYTDGVHADPTISVVANHPLYIMLSAGGNPAPTLSLVSAPSGVVFNGTITWTPTAAEVGPNYITVAATNSAGTTDTVIPVTVVADAPIPSLSINGGLTYGVGNMTADPHTPFTY
jgi:hypothetical protein